MAETEEGSRLLMGNALWLMDGECNEAGKEDDGCVVER